MIFKYLINKFTNRYKNYTLEHLANEKRIDAVSLGKNLANVLNINFLEKLDLSLYTLRLSEDVIIELEKLNFFPIYNSYKKELTLVSSYPYKLKIPTRINKKFNNKLSSSLSTEELIIKSRIEILKLKEIIKDYPSDLKNSLSILIIALKDSIRLNSFRLEIGSEDSKEYFCYTSDAILKGSISDQSIKNIKNFLIDNLQGRRFIDSLSEIFNEEIKFKISSPLSKSSSLSILITNSKNNKTTESLPIKDTLNELPHILLVDDDERFADLLKRGISNKGFRVSIAKSVSDAEKFFSSDPILPNLIISDLHMPDKSGISLLKSIRERGILSPIIILSSDNSIDAQLEILNMGAHAIVDKSSDPRILFAWIYRLIGVSKSSESQVV